MRDALLQAAHRLVGNLSKKKIAIGMIYDMDKVRKSHLKVLTGGGRVAIGRYDAETEIQLWHDEIIGRRCFWFGFNSPTKQEISYFADIWGGSFKTLINPKFTTVNDMEHYKVRLKEVDLAHPVLEDYKEPSEYYFGMFDGTPGRQDASPALNVSRATRFITKFMNISKRDQRKRVKSLIAVRQGSKKFRDRLLKAYGGKCAISGCSIEQVLDAVHIDRYRGLQSDKTSNGILLRTDLHTLFDLNLISIDLVGDAYVASVAKSARTGYGEFHRKKLKVPSSSASRPSPQLLREHKRGV